MGKEDWELEAALQRLAPFDSNQAKFELEQYSTSGELAAAIVRHVADDVQAFSTAAGRRGAGEMLSSSLPLFKALLLVGLSASYGWLMQPAPGVTRQSLGQPVAARAARMQEAEPAAVDDAFTEDLLDALAAEEPPLAPAPTSGTFVTPPEGAAELEPMPAYVNYKTVQQARDAWKTHATDTGSVQVQVAVLTARIAYMTKHMQNNKKDYASLRGLTAMVTRRRKLLEYLLREDLPEFKRITAELGIRTNQLLKPKFAGARGRRI